MMRSTTGHVTDVSRALIGHGRHCRAPCSALIPSILREQHPVWRKQRPRCRQRLITAVAMPDSPLKSAAEEGLPDRTADIAVAKRQLLQRIAGTQRGAAVSRMERGFITEAQIAVEAFGGELDFGKLEGTWRLLYTTASDVLPLVAASEGGSPVRVADIFQQFSSPAEGTVRNIIKLSVWPWLQEGDGARLCVDAEYEVRGGRGIGLTFRAAGEIVISPLLETLLAPALLPRTFISQQILLFLKELAIKVQLPRLGGRGGSSSGTGGSDRMTYLLTYLDDSMLIGRAPQGLFIFERA